MRPFTEEDAAWIVDNAIAAARRSILCDFAVLCLDRTDVPASFWRILADEASVKMNRTVSTVSNSLRLELEEDEEPPEQLVDAIVEFCTESPREMEELVQHMYVYVCCSKKKVRELIRAMEERGDIRNLGTEGRHRWVAAPSRWGAPKCVRDKDP